MLMVDITWTICIDSHILRLLLQDIDFAVFACPTLGLGCRHFLPKVSQAVKQFDA